MNSQSSPFIPEQSTSRPFSPAFHRGEIGIWGPIMPSEPKGFELAFAPTPEGLNPGALEYSYGCFALGAVLVHGEDLWISLRVSNIMDHYRSHLLHTRRMVRIFH